MIRNAARTWLGWLASLLFFGFLTVVAGVMDREVIERWQSEGVSGLFRWFGLGAAVFLRLVRDSRVPIVAKLLLLFAVLYGGARADLIPDGWGLRGWLDDAVLVVLAARGFMAACPESVVEEQALLTAQRRAQAEG